MFSRKIVLLVLSLFFSLTTLRGATRFADPAIRKAYDLFIPIACTNSQVFRFKIGTGFPVGKSLIMTAGHVDCVDAFGEGAMTEISNDKGKTWQRVPDDARFKHTQWDVQILMVDVADYKHVADFRKAVIGEHVAGYGIAFNETATAGFVMQSREDQVTASNAAIGGMSGSALVAVDGKVLGMTVQAQATIVGDGIPSSWVSIAIPGPVLEQLLKSFQEGGAS